ncbi:hypothetical protein DPX16_20171 [Anabarilius grahami]|uniref:Uncharacterized protein n=1 Tax=Anabarilius grahami TaxID=495550 RepID=A0A3N0XQW6_ANAGA|nr:hypothetical protein DPX16_20171 [Anabarilius grahami]
MSDSDELPEESVQVPDVEAVGNVIEQMRGQIQELSDWRNDTLANRAVGGGAVPTPRPRSKEKSQPDVKPVIMDENEMSELDFVVVEEVVQPSVRVAANSPMVSEASVTSELEGDSSEGIQVRASADTGRDSAEYDDVVLRATDERDQSQVRKFHFMIKVTKMITVITESCSKSPNATQ